MRVLFPLVALLAGAQALSSSLYQKRGGLDVCSNVECSVSLPNPLTGKTINFGKIGEITLVDPSLVLSDQNAQPVFFGRRVSLSFRNSFPLQLQCYSCRGFFGRWQIEGHGLPYQPSESATILRATDPPLDRALNIAMTDILRHHWRSSIFVGEERGKQLRLPRSRDSRLLQSQSL